MAAARSGIRHLQNGGALLLFGTGLIDPDPAVYPGAEKEIENWSPSIDLFLRHVPECEGGGYHRQRHRLSQVGAPSGHLAETDCLAEAPPG